MRQPREWRISNVDIAKRPHHFVSVWPSLDGDLNRPLPLRKNIPQQLSTPAKCDIPSDAYRSSVPSPPDRNGIHQQSVSSLTVHSSDLRDNFGSFFTNDHRPQTARRRRKWTRTQRVLLGICSCISLVLLLGLLAALLLGLLLRPQSSTTTTTTTTSTSTTVTTSTTTSTTSVTTTTTATTATTTSTSTSSSTTTTTTSTSTSTSTTTTTITTTTTTTINTTATTSTTFTTASTTTSTAILTTTTTTATTTTAFQCGSTITSTLNSMTESSCPKNNWHTFTNTFTASYTGLRTLVFSFANIKHATMYLTNIKVHDASNVQLLANGDFSSSAGTMPTNWLKCSDNGQVDSTCAVASSIACYTISTAGGSISQSFSVVSGTTYTIEFDLYHVSSSGNSDALTLNIAAV